MYRYWAVEIGWGKTQKGIMKRLMRKRWLCFSHFSIGASPIYYYLKILFVFFKVNIFLSVLDLCFHLCCPPSLLVRPSHHKLEATMWSAGAVPMRGRQSRIGTLSPAVLPAGGLGPWPKPVELWQKHLLWEGSLPTLIRHFFCSRIWWTVIRTFYFFVNSISIQE